MTSQLRLPVVLLFLGLCLIFIVLNRTINAIPVTYESPSLPSVERNLFDYEAWKQVLLDALGRIREGQPLTQSQEAVLEILRQRLLLHRASEKEQVEELLALLEMVLQINDQYFKDNPDAGQQRSDDTPEPGGH